MTILLILVTLLLFISIICFRSQGQENTIAGNQLLVSARLPAPQMEQESGFDIPRGYCFHPGHTWALVEGHQNARIGLDSFAANLIGKIDRIEVAGLYQWVRQGQKIWTVTRNGLSVDMLSPIEGVVITVNPNVLRDPTIATSDPYGEGWILVVKSPNIALNLHNLVHSPMARVWMENAFERLKEMTAQHVAPVAQAGGGLPLTGLLARVEPNVQQDMIREFFLT